MPEDKEDGQRQGESKRGGAVRDERIAPESRQPQLERGAGRSDGARTPDGKTAWSSRRKAAAVVAVVSVLLIVCSGLAIASSWSAGSQQEQAQEQEGRDGQEGSATAAQEASPSSVSDGGRQAGEEQATSSNEDSPGGGGSNAQGAQGGASASSGGGQDDTPSGGSSQDGASTSADGAYADAGSPQDAPSGAATSNVIRVSVVVDSSAADGSVQVSQTVDLQPGASAYDALVAAAANAGVGVRAANTQYGVYVAGIGGVSEKQFGGGSGWLYAVNGSTPGYAASACTLSDGDSVTWFYTRG